MMGSWLLHKHSAYDGLDSIRRLKAGAKEDWNRLGNAKCPGAVAAAALL